MFKKEEEELEVFADLNLDSQMEKLTLISGALFLTADIFAIIALALPYWIVTDVGGIVCNYISKRTK